MGRSRRGKNLGFNFDSATSWLCDFGHSHLTSLCFSLLIREME